MSHQELDRFLSKFLENIQKFNLIDDSDKRILIAFSGGQDSTFLTYAFNMLKEKLRLEIFLCHINHKTRPTSDLDEEFCKDFAHKLGLPIYIDRIDENYLKSLKGNLENNLRKYRLNKLKEIMNLLGCSKIALGHTKTDLVETFFMKLIRGTGIKGLRGILPKSSVFIRPLITFEREEIREILEKLKIPYREDPTNINLNLTRNFIRLTILPKIKERFPKVEDMVFRNALIHQELVDLLNSVITGEFGKTFVKTPFGGVIFNREKLETQHPFLLKYFLSNRFHLEFEDVEKIMSLLKRGKRISIKSLFLWPSQNEILMLERSIWRGLDYRERVIHGEAQVQKINLKFQIKNVERQLDEEGKFKAFISHIDLDSLVIRSYQYGDRINGRKVKDYFDDLKVPAWRRIIYPIVEDKGGIIWVPGTGAKRSDCIKRNQFILEVKKINAHEWWIFD